MDTTEVAEISIIIGLTVLFTFLILKATTAVLKKHDEAFGPKIHVRFFYNILRLFILIIAIVIIGSQFDFFSRALTTILASSGILALGLSLAAQESVSNIIDGLFLSIFKPFNIGDRVTLPEKNNLTGIVTEMNLRHTVIKTYSQTSYIIPNNVMNSAIVDNSDFHNKVFAYPIDVSVSYDSDLELAMKLMYDAVTELPEFVDPRTPEQVEAGAPKITVLVREFGDSGIALRCQMFTRNVNESFLGCSKARIAIKKAFDENGITIPFTTITISK